MKNWSKGILLGAAFMLGSFAAVANDNLKLGVVPQPENIKLLKPLNDEQAKFVIDNDTIIVYDLGLENVANYLHNFVRKSPYAMLLRTQKSTRKLNRKNIIRLQILPEANEQCQAYQLKSDKDMVIISAKSPQGVFYGVQTLLQLMPTDVYSRDLKAKTIAKNIEIPSVKVNDAPLFKKFRGLHVDVSRHFRTKEEMFKIIDWMAIHKLNTLQIHLTDDQGWRIEIKKYPKLVTVGGIGENSHRRKGKTKYFTQEDIKDIIAYAKSRYIKIIPEIDIPGHMEAAIRAYPELGSPSDLRKHKRVIRDDEKGLEFVKNVLREVKDLFDPEYIHVGFDEVNLGSKKPIYTNKQITAFARKVTQFLKNDLKVTPIVWDDAFEKGLDDDKDVLVHWWRTGLKHWWRGMSMAIDQKLQKYNQPYINSNSAFTYFDMKNVKEDKRGGQWAGVMSVAEVYNHDVFADLKDYDPSKRDLMQGTIAATWSETINDMPEFETRVFPRLAAFSENTWALPKSLAKGNKPSWIEYRDCILIPKQLERYKAMKIRYWGDAEKITKLPDVKKPNK